MKTCTKCQLEKPLDQFGKRSGKPHLYKSWCKKCVSANNARRNKERYDIEPGYKEKLAQYRNDNPDKIAQWRATEYENNRDDYLRRAAEWRKRNPAERAQASRRHKIKRKDWELTGSFSTEEWVALLDRTGHRCLACGSVDTPLTQDHVIPLSRGGLNIIENIQPLCGPCNSSKHTKTIDYRGD